jgi:hypothetical protein
MGSTRPSRSGTNPTLGAWLSLDLTPIARRYGPYHNPCASSYKQADGVQVGSRHAIVSTVGG